MKPPAGARGAPRAVCDRQGRAAGRIGIGGGSGLPADDLEHAVARGVNYLFVSSDFHAVLYEPMWRFLRRHRCDRLRERLVVAGCSYIADPDKLAGIVADQLLAWGLDELDVFVWGWVSERADAGGLLRAAHDVMRSPAGAAAVGAQLGVSEQLCQVLRERGYARHLGISTHDRAIARALLDAPQCDSLMVRYNVAHRGIEDELLPCVAAAADPPAIVTFNLLHDARGTLLRPPPRLPPGRYVPDAGDLYRFALDRPDVDVVLTGPANRAELDLALDALARPPLEPEVRAYLTKYGDLHAGRVPPRRAEPAALSALTVAGAAAHG